MKSCVYLIAIMIGLTLSACYDSKNNITSSKDSTIDRSNDKSDLDVAKLIYHSYKQCDLKNKCENILPQYRNGKAILSSQQPYFDEFYLIKNEKKYSIYYKNLFSEDYEIGWTNLNTIKSNDLVLVFESNKIYQTMGHFNVIADKGNIDSVQSENANKGFYYIDDHYDKFPFNQYQRFTFLKQQDGTLLLDCKSYLKDLDPENNYSGIFYGVCQDRIKVYFKAIDKY